MMLNIELILIIGILSFVAVLLHKSNVLKKEDLVRKEDDRLDIELRPKYPNLFLAYSNEIRRQYKRINKEKQKYIRHPNAYFLSGINLKRDWFEIVEYLIDLFKEKQKIALELKSLQDATVKFFEEIRGKCYLNAAELNFLAYLLWEVTENSEDDSYSKTFNKAIDQLRMVVNEYMKS